MVVVAGPEWLFFFWQAQLFHGFAEALSHRPRTRISAMLFCWWAIRKFAAVPFHLCAEHMPPASAICLVVLYPTAVTPVLARDVGSGVRV